MRTKDTSKRTIIQWIAFVIVMLAVLSRVVLFLTGIAQNLEYSTINAITWTGISIGILVFFSSYLFKEEV